MATVEAKKTTRKLKPLNDKIIVQKSGAEEKTEGGIYLPSSSQGPGNANDKGERQALQIKAGDRVLYSKYSGTEIKQDGKELLIIAEKDVLAIIE